MSGKNKKPALLRLVGDKTPAAAPAKSMERVDYSLPDLKAILANATKGPMSETDRAILELALDSYALLTLELEQSRVSIKRLKYIAFGASTESISNVKKGLGILDSGSDNKAVDETKPDVKDGQAADSGSEGAAEGDKPQDPKKRKGHGRRKVDDMPGARHVDIPHADLTPGQRCACCPKGRVYPLREPAKFLRIQAIAPIDAAVYELQRLRCNGCGTVFTASLPDGIPPEIYDASVTSLVSYLRYGAGLPFYRLEKLTEYWGVPMPASNLWTLVNNEASLLTPVLSALETIAANGELLYNDDTSMRVLNRDDLIDPPDTKPGSRKQVYTSGILSINGEHQVILFRTGLLHAGENLADILSKRDKALTPPIQMCDAWSATPSTPTPKGPLRPSWEIASPMDDVNLLKSLIISRMKPSTSWNDWPRSTTLTTRPGRTSCRQKPGWRTIRPTAPRLWTSVWLTWKPRATSGKLNPTAHLAKPFPICNVTGTS